MKMKRNKRKIFKLIAFFMIIALAAVLYQFRFFGLIFFEARYAERMRVDLLCKTDHQALLKACRELLRKVEAVELNTGFYTVRGSIFSPCSPEASQFPQVILDIKPRDVFIRRDGYVTLEMHGGMDHFGVQAYPDDFKEPFKGFKYGDREIIPGLWYYDENYVYDPDYDKRIEALLQKRK